MIPFYVVKYFMNYIKIFKLFVRDISVQYSYVSTELDTFKITKELVMINHEN